MKALNILLLAISTLNASISISQEVTLHRWENRVLLILTDNTNTLTFQNQIEALQNNENGLIERKLIIYQIEQHRYKIGLMDNEWQNSTKLYKKYKEKNTPFEIVLIGLDGGIKLRQSNLLTCEALFSIIDVMPMRREEIKNRRY